MSVIAVLSYAARFVSPEGSPPDLFFRWSTAIGTFILDAILLVAALLIARGLPLRATFALQQPRSWSDASRIALIALAVSWTTALVTGLLVGHTVSEQAVPEFFDDTRVPAFVANVIAVAVWAPIVEETLTRGLGFTLLRAWGERIALAGSAVAFAVAHGALFDLPWLVVTGLGLGVLRARSASLFPSIALHMVVNGIALLASAYLAGT